MGTMSSYLHNIHDAALSIPADGEGELLVNLTTADGKPDAWIHVEHLKPQDVTNISIDHADYGEKYGQFFSVSEAVRRPVTKITIEIEIDRSRAIRLGITKP